MCLYQLVQVFAATAQRGKDLLLLPLIVGSQRLLDVMAYAYVVNDKAFVLVFIADPIHTSDGLEQL